MTEKQYIDKDVDLHISLQRPYFYRSFRSRYFVCRNMEGMFNKCVKIKGAKYTVYGNKCGKKNKYKKLKTVKGHVMFRHTPITV